MQQAVAQRDQAQWMLDQKLLKSPVNGLVFDTLYYIGNATYVFILKDYEATSCIMFVQINVYCIS